MEGNKDFKPEELTKATEQHGKDISDLTSRVSAIEENLKPASLALTLESACDDSKKMDKLFSKLFCDMMDKDLSVKAAIEEHLQKSDRDAVWKFIKRFGLGTWSLILFILGLIAKGFIDKFFQN